MSIAERPAPLMPTHLDLPFKDDTPVDNFYQPEQSHLLSSLLRPHLDQLHPDGNYILGMDSGIYWAYKKNAPLSGCKSPDFFYVPGVPRDLNGIERRSYVLWQEGVPPLIVVEYVSGDGSEEHDAEPETGKFWVYERGIKARYYAIHDVFRPKLEVFELVRGRYRAMTPDSNGRFRIPAMKLDLGIWDGTYHSRKTNWLRAWDLNGNLLPAAEENAESEKQQAEQERQRAEQERQRAEQQQKVAEQERLRAEQQQKLAEQERLRAEQERQRAEQERQRAEQQQKVAEQERQRAEQERQRAEQQKNRIDALAARLRELGIDPDNP